MVKGRGSGKGGKGECGKTCSLSLHPFPPTDHPAAAARSKRGAGGDGGGRRKRRAEREDRGWLGGGEQEEKGNSEGRSREVWRRERGCRTPIRSIAAYSPYTFTTSLEFRALRLFFFSHLDILLEQRYPRDYANAYNIEISSGRRPNLIFRFTEHLSPERH